MHSVDIIIPAYKPGEKFIKLLDMLEKQTYPIHRVIVVNTEEKYFDRLLFFEPRRKFREKMTVRHISKREFDHGGTRRLGVSLSNADIFVCMTDDAVPADEYLVEKLVSALLQEKVAVAYARQLAGEGATETERFARNYNYPAKSLVKSQEDLGTLGIKTYFCSNVCAAYWRNIYEESGGFVKHTIFNEDMLYAAGVVKQGYRIAYAADAEVYHSHSYTNKQQFQRNFDLGVSQAQHPEVFEGILSEGEGIRMVKQTATHLKEKKQSGKILGLYVTSGFKFLGYRFGKAYRILPKCLIKRFSMNKGYWEKESI